MRSFPLAAIVASIALSGACAPTPPITVIHLAGDTPSKDADVVGDPVAVRRPPADKYSAVRSGAYVVRNTADWQELWRGAAERPEFPQTLDPTKDMLVVIANQDERASHLKVTRAVETGGQLTLWVRQTRLGEGCVRARGAPRAIDAVVTPRIDKPLKFLVEDEQEPSCGEPPKAEISCRLASTRSWAPKMTAKAGDVVECELSTVARGKYELVDQTLTLADVPPESKAKLAFYDGARRATLALDTFGTYAVRAEATDDAGRKGHATALIDVVPKKTRDVLMQVTWTDLDGADPNTSAPRVMLRVAQEGPRGQRCSAEVPVPGLCEASTRGAYTYMKIPASRRKLPVSLLYLDPRPQAGPAPCVNVWFDGERTVSVCDRDRRSAEDRWEIGTLDTTSGKLAPPRAPAEPNAKPARPMNAPAPKSTPAALSSNGPASKAAMPPGGVASN